MGHFFWQGIMHPILTPSHLMVLIALGLVTGQQGGRQISINLPALMASVCVGLMMSRVMQAPWNAELVLLVLALLLGGLAALQWRLPLWVGLCLGLAAGVVIGLDSAVAALPGMRGFKIYAGLVGTGVSASLLFALFTLTSFYLHKLWQGIGVRILGAWVTAGAVMVLALELSAPLRATA